MKLGYLFMCIIQSNIIMSARAYVWCDVILCAFISKTHYYINRMRWKCSIWLVLKVMPVDRFYGITVLNTLTHGAMTLHKKKKHKIQQRFTFWLVCLLVCLLVCSTDIRSFRTSNHKTHITCALCTYFAPARCGIEIIYAGKKMENLERESREGVSEKKIALTSLFCM